MLCLVFPRGFACGLCVLRALPSPSIGSASSVISRARRPALTVVHVFTAQFPPVPYCEQPRNSPRRQLDWSQGLCWPCTPNPHKTRGALGYGSFGFRPHRFAPPKNTWGGCSFVDALGFALRSFPWNFGLKCFARVWFRSGSPLRGAVGGGAGKQRKSTGS